MGSESLGVSLMSLWKNAKDCLKSYHTKERKAIQSTNGLKIGEKGAYRSKIMLNRVVNRTQIRVKCGCLRSTNYMDNMGFK
jgi:hypothetical protein